MVCSQQIIIGAPEIFYWLSLMMLLHLLQVIDVYA